MLTLQHKIAAGPRKENETKLTDQLTEKAETNYKKKKKIDN